MQQMPTDTLQIGEFCQTGSGGTPSRSNAGNFDGGNIPWVKSGELKSRLVESAEESITETALRTSSAKVVPKGALLVAMYGATVGEVSELGIDAATNQAVCHIVPDPARCDRNYLFHALVANKPILLGRRVGGAQPNISQGIIKALEIPLPSLTEQRRIAAILDKADALRTKRREAIAKLDRLLQSVFLDIFGDPVANPKGWATVGIADLAMQLRDGPFGSNLKSEHYKENGVRVVRLQNIGVWRFIGEDAVYISEQHYESLPRNHCRPGDVLVGTLGDPNLRACILPSRIDRALNKADCLLFRPNLAVATAEYVCGLLNCASFIRNASGLALGQTRLRISMGRLKELSVPVPPLETQERFTDFCRRFESVRSNAINVADHSERMFSALQTHAFLGHVI